MTTPLITGKIAYINLTTSAVVINVGATHGVTVDMRFLVGETAFVTVHDPDTGEALGRIGKTPRLPLTVGRVATRMALCVAGIAVLSLPGADRQIYVGAPVTQVMEGIDDLP